MLKFKSQIVIIMQYFIGYLFVYPIIFAVLYGFLIANGVYYDSAIILLDFLLYSFVFVSIGMLAKPLLIYDFKALKGKISNILFESSKSFLYLFLANIIINLILFIILQTNSANQQTIEKAFIQAPLFIFLVSVLFAPFVEEIVFRACIYKLCTKKLNAKTSALLSGIAFGLIHVVSSLLTQNYADIIYLISYGTMGYILGMLYYRTNNIYSVILCHFMNNLIAFLMMLG